MSSTSSSEQSSQRVVAEAATTTTTPRNSSSRLEAAILFELSECVHLLSRLQRVLSDMVERIDQEEPARRSSWADTVTTDQTQTFHRDDDTTHPAVGVVGVSLSCQMDNLLQELQEWDKDDATG